MGWMIKTKKVTTEKKEVISQTSLKSCSLMNSSTLMTLRSQRQTLSMTTLNKPVSFHKVKSQTIDYKTKKRWSLLKIVIT